MQQNHESTRPEERYDPSNPLWSGQQVVAQMHPQTMRMEYYSLNYRTKARYWHAKCHKCLLYGHVKWMCPHSICTNCGQTCGKSPFRCKKDSQQRAEEVVGSSSRNMEPPAYDATPTTIQLLTTRIVSGGETKPVWIRRSLESFLHWPLRGEGD